MPVQTSPQVRIGKPQLLFEKEIFPDWDISLDDQRILAVVAAAPVTSGEIDVVLNWFDELQRRVPPR